jgi:hypothetical protein
MPEPACRMPYRILNLPVSENRIWYKKRLP